MAQDLIDENSTGVQFMAWHHQVASHYLNQNCSNSVMPYGIISRGQWVKSKTIVSFFFSKFIFDPPVVFRSNTFYQTIPKEFCHDFDVMVFTLNRWQAMSWINDDPVHLYGCGSGHKGVAVLLHGFAIKWWQNQVTRQPYLRTFMTWPTCIIRLLSESLTMA